MAKFIDRGRLTAEEIETLNTYEANGIEVYPAPNKDDCKVRMSRSSPRFSNPF